MAEPIPGEAERRLQLPAGSFPFASRFIDVEGCWLHYIDEGKGPVLFMLHGNPTWSFIYRHLVSDLCRDFRCVAVDLPGFGLSDATPGYSFKPEEHARIIAGFLEALDIRDATLVGHDWGGPVGFGAMGATDGRITGLCLGNTWAWPVNGDLHFEWFSKLMGGPIGRFGTNRYLMFTNMVMPAGIKRRKLSQDELDPYRAPYAGDKPRTGMHVFPEQITGAGPWLSRLEQLLTGFKGPALLIWPQKDIAFRHKELKRWQSLLPQASTVELENCGHFLWEDAPEDCIRAIRDHLC